MRKTIDKKDIIKALKSEPLLPGRWASDEIGPLDTCPVCAVGAVIREVIYPECNDPNKFDDTAEAIVGGLNYCAEDFPISRASEVSRFKSMIKEQGYFAALSSYFEYLSGDTQEEFEDLFLKFELGRITEKQFDKEVTKLLDRVKKTVTPKLVKMVEETFPTRVKLPEEYFSRG